MRHVGCTGYRGGLTPGQSQTVSVVLLRLFLPGSVLHHGDCVGSDQELALLGRDISYRLVAHPPIDPRLRAFVVSDVVAEPLAYLARNWQIVRSSQVLVATPDGPERVRSGTWSTVRYAREQRVPRVLVWPDGRMTCELD